MFNFDDNTTLSCESLEATDADGAVITVGDIGDDEEAIEAAHTGLIDDTDQAVDAMVALQDITDAHAATVSLDDASGRALMASVEAICNIRVLRGAPAVKMPAFEEFSTERTRRAITQESFEDIKKAACAILDKIIEMIHKIIDFMKQYFNRYVRKNRATSDEVKTNAETVKKILALPAPDREKYIKKEFRDDNLWFRLNIDGKMPDGFGLVRAMQAHTKQMETFETSFTQRDKFIMGKLETALSSVHKPGDAFGNNIEYAMSAISQPHLTTKAVDQKAIGELDAGCVLYYQDLKFGNKIYYQVGGTAGMHPKAGTFKVAIQDDGKHSNMTPEVIEPLSLAEVEDLNGTLKNHTDKSYQWLQGYTAVDDRLRKMAREIANKRNRKEYDERALRRYSVIYEVLYMFMSLRSTADMAVARYDQTICSSVLDYIERSIKLPNDE